MTEVIGCQALIDSQPCGAPARFYDARTGHVCGRHRARCVRCGEPVDDHPSLGDAWHHGCWVAAGLELIASTMERTQAQSGGPETDRQLMLSLAAQAGGWVRQWHTTRLLIEQMVALAEEHGSVVHSEAEAELLAMDIQMGRIARLMSQLRATTRKR